MTHYDPRRRVDCPLCEGAEIPEQKQICIENAPTFLDNARDPEALAFDLAWVKDFSEPVLLTKGDQSPPTHAPVIDKLAGALPNAEVVTFPGGPHSTRHTPGSLRPSNHRFRPEEPVGIVFSGDFRARNENVTLDL